MPYRSVSAAYLRQAADVRENAGQLAAYNSAGHCVVLAGPGSGKTKTLILKLARILAEDVQAPRGVACITYSHECARELKRRLERLNPPPCGQDTDAASATWGSFTGTIGPATSYPM